MFLSPHSDKHNLIVGEEWKGLLEIEIVKQSRCRFNTELKSHPTIILELGKLANCEKRE